MSDLSSYNFLTAAHYISEPKKAVMKGNGKMSKKTSNNMICAATAMVAGGIAFAATKAMTSNKTQNVKKATGKAIKAVGAVIDVKSNMVYTLCKHMVYMLSITNEHKNELEMRAKPEWKVHFLCFASAKRGSFSIR